MKKAITLTALLLIAALTLSSCGIISKPKQTTTEPAVTTSITTLPRATTAPKTTTYPKENFSPQTTTKTPAANASSVSQQLTDLFKGEKLTDTKQYLIQSGIFESKIYLYTNAGETLDGALNAPSTYDVTRIVYDESGKVSIYGEKVRIIPDALKEFAGDVAMEAATQKIVDMILY